jgi:hypothetical protein
MSTIFFKNSAKTPKTPHFPNGNSSLTSLQREVLPRTALFFSPAFEKTVDKSAKMCYIISAIALGP